MRRYARYGGQWNPARSVESDRRCVANDEPDQLSASEYVVSEAPAPIDPSRTGRSAERLRPEPTTESAARAAEQLTDENPTEYRSGLAWPECAATAFPSHHARLGFVQGTSGEVGSGSSLTQRLSRVGVE